MNTEILKRMTGEELLLLRILNGESTRPAIEAELDRRAMMGPPARSFRQAGPVGAIPDRMASNRAAA